MHYILLVSSSSIPFRPSKSASSSFPAANGIARFVKRMHACPLLVHPLICDVFHNRHQFGGVFCKFQKLFQRLFATSGFICGNMVAKVAIPSFVLCLKSGTPSGFSTFCSANVQAIAPSLLHIYVITLFSKQGTKKPSRREHS